MILSLDGRERQAGFEINCRYKTPAIAGLRFLRYRFRANNNKDMGRSP